MRFMSLDPSRVTTLRAAFALTFALLVQAASASASPPSGGDREHPPETLTAPHESGEEDGAFEISSYAEILYSHYDYGPDRLSGENGSASDSRSIADVRRFVLEFEYEYADDLYFEAEIEFEHGGAGAALEAEHGESGEYETEIEKGGEIVLEELHLTKVFSPAFSLRAGHVLVPVGLINAYHLPTDFFTTVRPEAETSLLPATWHETGVEVFGRIAPVRYRLLLVNGLDSSGFDSGSWIRGGHQGRFELVKATGLAAVARLDYGGIEGVVAGVSGYMGSSTANRPGNDMDGVDGTVSILDAHLTVSRRPWIVRGLVLYGALRNADVISRKNEGLPEDLGGPRTPVARRALAWSLEAGYDIGPLLLPGRGIALYPFARYEAYDSMYDTDPGIIADPRFDRTVATVGLNLFVTDQVVIKADYSMRRLGEDRFNDENTASLALGFHTR